MLAEMSRSKFGFAKRSYLDADTTKSNVDRIVVLVGACETILWLDFHNSLILTNLLPVLITADLSDVLIITAVSRVNHAEVFSFATD